MPYQAVPFTLLIKPENNEAHKIEGCIAMFFSFDYATTNCDHMVDMLKHNIYNCKATDDVKMHCTKCTDIITNVLCPHFERAH